MSERAPTPTESPAVPEEGTPPAAPPRRSPGHRGQDVRDTVAELAARAHEISLEAGSKMASALKDVINAAAGITSFAVESARDLVQYMVRRGQMTQEEADKLIREAEAAHQARTRNSGKSDGPKPAASAANAKKPAPKPAPAPPKPKVEGKAEPKAESKPEPKPEAKAEAKTAPAKKAPPPAKKAAAAAKKPANKK